MKIDTRLFGEVDIEDEKIITFDKGIIGFPEMKRFTLIYDEEKGSDAGIRFLQSVEEPRFAMPVMDPLLVKDGYNPSVNDELLAGIGKLTEENILVLVSVTIPSELEKMSVNLQGPFVINTTEKKACQVIVESDEYPVRFPIYDILKARKAGE